IRNPKSEIQNRVPRHLPYCLSLLIFAVGLLAREEVVMLPFFLCALGWLDRKRWPQGRWKSLIPFFILACAFLVIRASIAGHTEASENVMDGTGAGRAVSVAATLLNYVSLLALPVNLCADRVFDVPLLILAGAGLFAGLAVLAALASRERTWLIGLALGLIVLLPASNIIPLPDRPLAEQRAYLAGVGYATVMACTLRGLARMRMWATFVAVLATLTVARNFAWRENATLAADTVLSAPRLIRPRVGLAVARLDKGNSQGAERELTRVLDAAPDHPEATYLLAVSYDRLGKLPEALSQYQKAVALGVGGVDTRCNMGSLYLKMGLCAQAAAEFRSVLSELDAPAGRADARAHARALRVHAHIGLGSALSDLGEPGEAETHLRAAIDAGAESASLHAALGLMRVKQGKLAEAAEDLAEARKLDPRLW
ncbi:MAG: tetratricopeptide repeat protein, partial [Planctomycetes bacterium]|nr:tetratricopeptide repeat protein [Planctomycetota bacterium]